MNNWKNIKDFSDYQISNNGLIKRNKNSKNNRFKKGMILKPYRTIKCYLHIDLYKDNNKFPKSVHRLVLETFNPIDNMENLQVNHINGIKTDNRLENLEWCTCLENINHAFKNGLRNNKGINHPMFGKHHSDETKKLIGKNNSKTKFMEKDIIEIKICLKNGVSQKEIAKQFNTTQANISLIINGKRWGHING